MNLNCRIDKQLKVEIDIFSKTKPLTIIIAVHRATMQAMYVIN